MEADNRASVLVVGGSSGVGLACVKRLVDSGRYQVFTASRSPAANSVEGATYVPLDATDDKSVTDAVSEVHQRAGRIDVLVYSAGYALAGPTELTSIEEAKSQFETNFWGAVRVNQAVLPGMRRSRSGIIVNVSSLAGLLSLP